MNAQEREILREKLRVERLTRKEELKQRLDEEKQRRKAEKAKVTAGGVCHNVVLCRTS